jgi:uncharacterized protein (DUF1684 family)
MNSKTKLITAGIGLLLVVLVANVLTTETEKPVENPPVLSWTTVSDLYRKRKNKDATFKNETDETVNPLTPTQREIFDSLRYFPISDSFRSVGRLTESKHIENQPRGKVIFELDGQQFSLTAWPEDPKDTSRLFIAFRDPANRYPGGRFLSAQVDSYAQVRLDFQQCYLPYCAYNPAWTCPLPDPENNLPYPIRAGERYEPGLPWLPLSDK